MSTQLAKQISARMRAKSLSVTMLEREAGLKTHAVQNILRGKSKKPSAELLQAVADVLGCTVKELLESQDIFDEDEASKSKNEILESPYEYPTLLQETVKLVNEKLHNNANSISTQQALTCMEEIYLHSLQKDPSKVDQDFAEWFIELMVG
jgi:transcriptional regulator with XRE-family HTH domain